MRHRHQTAKAASAGHAFVDAGIDTAFVDVSAEDSKQLAYSAATAHQTIPHMAIHPVRNASGECAESDDRVCVKFVEPHFVFEKIKQRRLRLFEWICFRATLLIL